VSASASVVLLSTAGGAGTYSLSQPLLSSQVIGKGMYCPPARCHCAVPLAAAIAASMVASQASSGRCVRHQRSA